MKTMLWILAAFLALPHVSWTGEPKGKKEADPKDVPLSLEIKSVKASYKIDLGGKTGKEFLEMVEAALEAGREPPKPPAVELQVVVKNTGKEKIQFWTAGNPVKLDLELKGPGAKTINPRLAFPAIFMLPKPTPLEPGKTHTFTLKTLQSGFRGVATWHYWTEPGEYTLVARLHTGVSPVPPGVKEEYGAGKVTLTSPVLKVTVEK
jgi:hypothetical protein